MGTETVGFYPASQQWPLPPAVWGLHRQGPSGTPDHAAVPGGKGLIAGLYLAVHPLKRSLTAQGRLAPALCSYRAGKVFYIVRSKWLDRHTYWVPSERLGARKPILPAPLIDLDRSQSAAVFRMRRTIACPIHHNPGRSPGPDHRNPHSKSDLLLSERRAGHAERRDGTTECHLAASRSAGVCATHSIAEMAGRHSERSPG